MLRVRPRVRQEEVLRLGWLRGRADPNPNPNPNPNPSPSPNPNQVLRILRAFLKKEAGRVMTLFRRWDNS